GNCVSGLGNQNTFVMGGCTGVGSDYVKRHPNESEKDILCQLGYGFQAHTNGLPEYGTLHTPNSLIRHGYSANCEPPCGVVANCDIASVYYAESVTVSPLLNDNNGANATVNQLVFHTTNAGSFSFDPNTQSVTFTPNGVFSGWAIFSYVPKCSNGEEGNTAFIFIEVIRCECENDPIVVGDPSFPNTVTDLSQTTLVNALPAGSCIIVNGILNIDVGFVIPQGCRWIMMPGSRIDVQENITVLPNNLFHGCDAMWQGIRVFKHRLLSMESSRVEDADNGVWVLDWGQISLRNNVFFKNEVGLRFEDPSSSTSLNCVILALDNNTFHCENANLFPPNAPNTISFAGIVSDRYSLIISQKNTFRDMRFGIHANSGNLVVKNCVFSHIRDNVNPLTTNGVGIYQFSPWGTLNSLHVYGDYPNTTLEFDDCRIGIEAIRQHTTIVNCDMEQVEEGVKVLWSQNSSHRIHDNRIQCNRVGIDFYFNAPVTNMHIRDNYIRAGTATAPADAGIRIDDGANTSTNLFIYENIVDMDYATLGYSITNTSNLNLSNNIANLSCTQPSTGFYLNFSPGLQFSCNRAEAIANCGVSSAGIAVAASNSSTIQCNHTLNTHWGHLYANYTSTNPLLTIRGNTIGDHDIGLRYTNSVNFLSQSLQGNLWTGTYGTAGAVHDGGSPAGNEYFMSTVTSTPICPPTVIIGTNPIYSIGAGNMNTQAWFVIPTPLGATFECADSGIVCAPAITSLIGGGNNNDYQLIEGEIEYESYPGESGWAAKRDLYNRILNDTTLLQDSLLAAFFYTYQDSSEGQYQEVSYQMNEAFRLQPITEAQLELLSSQLQIANDSLIVLDSLLQTTSDTTSYLPIIYNIRLTINGLQIQYNAVLQGIEALRNNTFNYLQTENGLLPSNEIYEQYEQIINEIYLSTVAIGNIDFTTEQIADLETISHQCPLAGGNSVYKARALYTIISNNSYYNDELLCAQAGIQYKQIQDKQVEKRYEIYPNPSDNAIQIRQIDKRKGYGSIEIKDSYGRFLLSQAITENEYVWEINTASLTSGVYFLIINRSGQSSYVHKIVIIR
ncbi:MAG: T9SS type A sorting domain-containing protein, partial [Bacteroidia bacterium]|nr:T9SS type A sorting domain-containing protein [Bacteroidia bacterium]